MLGHPKTRLFITHCGNNGQYEAVYHGVPMLGFPLFADQQHNSFRIAEQGIGMGMDKLHFEVPDLVNNIKTLLGNSTHRKKILHKSKIMKESMSRMTPVETVSFWVDHILKYGSDHLKSSAFHTAWYQPLMIEMLPVITASILVVLCLTYYLIKITRYLIIVFIW